jgi:hypothetical protein
VLGNSYRQVALRNVTQWLRFSPFSSATHEGVRLPFAVSFSPCGRYAVVHDQKALFGWNQNSYAFVLVDLARRRERLRVLPMADVNDLSPRMLQWTAHGIYALARHGAVLLQANA